MHRASPSFPSPSQNNRPRNFQSQNNNSRRLVNLLLRIPRLCSALSAHSSSQQGVELGIDFSGPRGKNELEVYTVRHEVSYQDIMEISRRGGHPSNHFVLSLFDRLSMVEEMQ
jgi:hypothetical protein